MDKEPELLQLTSLLGQCLGRIDEEAFRLQNTDDWDPEEMHDRLENEAARLQELMSNLLDTMAQSPVADSADLDKAVVHAVRSTLQELPFPILIHTHLGPDLPKVACRPVQLAGALQRALLLGASHAGTGGDVTIRTRAEQEHVLFELIACGRGSDPEARRRATTLAEFVARFGARCRVEQDFAGSLLLLLELPTSPVTDEQPDR